MLTKSLHGAGAEVELIVLAPVARAIDRGNLVFQRNSLPRIIRLRLLDCVLVRPLARYKKTPPDGARIT